jgi:peptidoglycan/LPS O-acetylase OafA/YrhL
VLFPYAVLCLALTPNRILSSFGKYGDYSYGIYLWAWPIQQAVAIGWGDKLTFVEYLAIVFGLSLACAIASWHLIEKRALHLKPQGRTQNAEDICPIFGGAPYTQN